MTFSNTYIPTLIIFFFQFTSNAQIGNPAPDFTATDTHGETHKLYDYLEDGKIVVLDFFYTTCGPCQFYSPQVNLAYEKYGCNTAEVIFMAIDWGDTDGEVIAYDEEYQIEYPSISGVDGGGNEIVNLYNVNGFPTFYVIDSSKTIIDHIDPPTLQVFDFRFEQHGITPSDCNSTAVSESILNKQLNFYPNPLSHGMLAIDLEEFLSEKVILEIFNSNGKTVLKEQLSPQYTIHHIPIDQLKPGTYLIKIEALKSDEKFSGLFVKI